MTPRPHFDGDDVMRMLAGLCGDRTLIAERVGDWMDMHVHTVHDAFVLLFTTAAATAELAGWKPGLGEMVGIELDDAAEPPQPHVLQAMQLVAAAGNRDEPMLTALILPIVKAGEDAAGPVQCELLRLFRSIYDHKAAETAS